MDGGKVFYLLFFLFFFFIKAFVITVLVFALQFIFYLLANHYPVKNQQCTGTEQPQERAVRNAEALYQRTLLLALPASVLYIVEAEYFPS